MKKLLASLLLLALLAPVASKADEGMWLLPFIKQNNIEAMKKAGFRLSAEDIYSVNQHALKDAIVIFGAGCTGEVISPKGLVITNHHCGYDVIQSHSSVENDYLKYGYWASSVDKEIPSPGLGVIFIRRIEDVTPQIMEAVRANMTDAERAAAIDTAGKRLVKLNSEPDKNISARVVPMFGGNQYLLFVQERFGDVRFVGAPPTSIGKFGGEQDNWMWPRHTGDFSMFRIYATKDGKSTKDYQKDNIAYNAPKHLAISSKGVQKGDYAMILGFPGTTARYMTTWEIDKMLSQDNPMRIYIRGEKQRLMWEDMVASDAVRIKYASKYARSANYWKNSIGKSRGIKRLKVRDRKEAEQQAFTAWVNADEGRKAKYGEALPLIQQSVEGLMPFAKTLQICSEIFRSTEAINLSVDVNKAIADAKGDSVKMRSKLKKDAASFFKDYNVSTDKKITKRLLQIYLDYTAEADRMEWTRQVAKDVEGWVESYFARSPFVDSVRFARFVESLDVNANAEFLTPAIEISRLKKEATDSSTPFNGMFSKGHRLYLAGLLEMNGGKGMYPDANSTMRMSYGNVLPYKGGDALNYDYFTTLSGVMEKENAEDPEFVVPAKLKELWQKKEFGRWAQNGDVATCFLSSNDITGGNSGSPVLNGNGELIGIAFDGNWEAMSGDVAFEPVVQRTINVDIRYILFIIDKFAGAQRLIDEMTIK